MSPPPLPSSSSSWSLSFVFGENYVFFSLCRAKFEMLLVSAKIGVENDRRKLENHHAASSNHNDKPKKIWKKKLFLAYIVGCCWFQYRNERTTEMIDWVKDFFKYCWMFVIAGGCVCVVVCVPGAVAVAYEPMCPAINSPTHARSQL